MRILNCMPCIRDIKPKCGLIALNKSCLKVLNQQDLAQGPLTCYELVPQNFKHDDDDHHHPSYSSQALTTSPSL
jgi:hypothetical protein